MSGVGAQAEGMERATAGREGGQCGDREQASEGTGWVAGVVRRQMGSLEESERARHDLLAGGEGRSRDT